MTSTCYWPKFAAFARQQGNSSRLAPRLAAGQVPSSPPSDEFGDRGQLRGLAGAPRVPAAPARDAARRPSTTSSGPPTCCRAVARLPERWPPCRSVARVPEVPVAGDEGSRRPPAQPAPASGGRPPRSGCRRWPVRPRPRPAGCCPAPRRPGELLIPRRRVPRARGPRRGRTVRRATRRRARFRGPARGLARGGRAQGPTRGGGRRVRQGRPAGHAAVPGGGTHRPAAAGVRVRRTWPPS